MTQMSDREVPDAKRRQGAPSVRPAPAAPPGVIVPAAGAVPVAGPMAPSGAVVTPPVIVVPKLPPAPSARPSREERSRPSTRRHPGVGCLLGVDIGTTGAKAMAFTPDGHPVGRGYEDYPLITAGGVAELDATQVTNAVRRAIREAAAAARTAGHGPVLALAFAAQGEAFTLVDARLRPLRHSIVTFDQRGQAGVGALRAMGWEARVEHTGLPLSWIVTAAKLAHLRIAEADTYGRAAHVLCFEDLLVGHLTGTPVISDSLAQRTWLLDRKTRQWDAQALADLGLSGRMANVAPPGQVVGTVGASAAGAFGLTTEVRVVTGAHDQTAALLGAGAILPGMAAHSIGTVDCMSLTLRDGVAAPFASRGYGLGIHPLPGLAVTLAFGFGGGALLAWARALTGASDVGALLAEVPEAVGTSFAVPFWSGSGTPDLDAADQGALFGLTLDTGRGEIAGALLRGMALEGRRNLQVLHELGVEVGEVRLVGGGSRSATWNQLRADVASRTYAEMTVRDAGCLGAAILAAVGIGLYRDVATACDALVRSGQRFTPDPARVAHYDRLFPAYLAAVQATRAARPTTT